jgi:hypothetical protein
VPAVYPYMLAGGEVEIAGNIGSAGA